MQLIKFIKFILYDRQIYTVTLREEYRLANKGVPQGDFFIHCFTLFMKKDILKSVKVFEFADDLGVYSSFSRLSKCRNTIEKAVNKIIEYLSEIGLELAPQKTVLVLFNNQAIKPGQTEIKIDNYIIKSNAKVRFLGITFDYNFF